MDYMNPQEIRTHETFVNLFPIKQEILDKIEEHIRDNKFLITHPLDLATWNGQKEPVCIDGHTRLQAAINVGLAAVPVMTHELDTEDEALELAIHLQRNRRNMTDADIIACIQAVDSRKERGGDRRSKDAESKASSDAIEKSTSKSAKETADLLGTSTTKVERARAVLNHADPQTLEAVKGGDMSLNKAHGEIQKKRRNTKQAKKNKDTAASPVEARSDGEGRSDHGINGLQKESASTNGLEHRSVVLSPSHYKALENLGGLITQHVGRAIDLYLASLDVSDDKPTSC